MPEINTREHYKLAQSKFRCKVGDKVKVSHKCPSYTNGWQNSWEPRMDRAIGNIGTIDGIYGDIGINLKEYDACFPYFVLYLLE